MYIYELFYLLLNFYSVYLVMVSPSLNSPGPSLLPYQPKFLVFLSFCLENKQAEQKLKQTRILKNQTCRKHTHTTQIHMLQNTIFEATFMSRTVK